MRHSLVLVALLSATGARAGTVTTRSGKVLDTEWAGLELYPGRSELSVSAKDADGFHWTLQALLPLDDPALRSFDLALFDGVHRGGVDVLLESGGQPGAVVVGGTAHVEIGNGLLRIEVDNENPDAAAIVDAVLHVGCSSGDDALECKDGIYETDFCRPFHDLFVPDADGEAEQLAASTAAVIEGRVSAAVQSHEGCAGPRTSFTLSDVVTRAGPDMGPSVVLKNFGGPDASGGYVFVSDAGVTPFAKGERYLVFLKQGPWHFSPVADESALLIRTVRGKDVLIHPWGFLVLGFDGGGWRVGPWVAEPNNEITRPFDPPTIDGELLEASADCAATPDTVVQQFVDFAREHQIPLDGEFRPEPQVSAEDGWCQQDEGRADGGCSSGGGPASLLATLALLASACASTARGRRGR